ncbi:MAG: hypothetical protein ACPGVU_22885 [Limisphaerales bacterium]
MEPDKKLAAEIDRQLKQLPEQTAPSGLACGVMAALRQFEARPWWQKSWFEWPLALKWVSGIVALVMFSSMGLADYTPLAGYFHEFESAIHHVTTSLGGQLESIMEIAWSIVAAIPLYGWVLMILAFAMSWMTTLGLGVVCYQVARTRKHTSAP